MGRQGEVLRELPRFDPALEAHPQIDRYLVHPPPSVDSSDILLSTEPGELESRRRRAYFEWSEEEIERLTGASDTLGLAQGRHLRVFRELAAEDNDEERAKLIERLCGGISRLEALPPQSLPEPARCRYASRPEHRPRRHFGSKRLSATSTSRRISRMEIKVWISYIAKHS